MTMLAAYPRTILQCLVLIAPTIHGHQRESTSPFAQPTVETIRPSTYHCSLNMFDPESGQSFVTCARQNSSRLRSDPELEKHIDEHTAGCIILPPAVPAQACIVHVSKEH
jgi:hypothetical protein